MPHNKFEYRPGKPIEKVIIPLETKEFAQETRDLISATSMAMLNPKEEPTLLPFSDEIVFGKIYSSMFRIIQEEGNPFIAPYDKWKEILGGRYAGWVIDNGLKQLEGLGYISDIDKIYEYGDIFVYPTEKLLCGFEGINDRLAKSKINAAKIFLDELIEYSNKNDKISFVDYQKTEDKSKKKDDDNDDFQFI